MWSTDLFSYKREVTGQVSEARVGQRVLLAKLIGLDLMGAEGLWEDFSRKELWAGVGTRWEGAGAWMWGMESRSGNSEAESEAWQLIGIRCRVTQEEPRGFGQNSRPHKASVSPLVRWTVNPDGLWSCFLL